MMGPPGHLAIGFAARAVTSKVPLRVLLVDREALVLSAGGIAIYPVARRQEPAEENE